MEWWIGNLTIELKLAQSDPRHLYGLGASQRSNGKRRIRMVALDAIKVVEIVLVVKKVVVDSCCSLSLRSSVGEKFGANKRKRGELFFMFKL